VPGPGPGPDVGRVFREEYGRAVSVLVRVFGDIDIAEDAVQDAFARAAARWPADGLPPSPAGWIITTARNQAIDRLRREASRASRHAQAALLHASQEAAGAQPAEEGPVRDDRLRLLFTCCHPALSPARPGRAHPPAARRADHGADRARVPGARADHGSAADPGQGQDPRRADPVPGTARAGPARPPRRRAGRAVPHLQRGVHGEHRRPADPGRPVRRGHPARAAPGHADAGRAGGHRAAGPDAADRVPADGPDCPGREPGSAGRPGSEPLGPRAHRRGADTGPAVPAPRPARPLPDPGGHQRGARRYGARRHRARRHRARGHC